LLRVGLLWYVDERERKERSTTMIELNEDQQRALREADKGPVKVVNPATQEVFVLVRQDVYELVRKIIDGPNRRGWDDPELDVYEQYRKKKK
jgi:hypothetical protein